MSRKIRLLLLIIVFVFTFSVLPACQSKTPQTGSETGSTQVKSSPEAPKKNVTLKMWGGVPPESGPQQACDNFNKEFASKGITVEYERFVNDDQGNLKLETNLLAGNDIDVYMTYSLTRMVKRAEGNMSLDLSELAKRDNYNIEDKYGSLVKTWLIKDKYFSLPTTKGNVCLIVNKDMFDAAKIPIPTFWTVDEFRETAKKLTKGEGQNKVYGMFFFTSTGNDIPMNMANTTLGTDWALKPGVKESYFNNSTAEKYLQTIYDMMYVDKSAPTHIDSVTQKLTIEGMFLSGKSAMSVGAWITRSIRDLEKYPHNFKTAYVPFPVADKNSQFNMAGSVGDALCINPKSKNINEAWEFIKWYGDKGMEPLIPGGRVPLNKSFNADNVTKLSIEGAENLIDSKSYKDMMITTAKQYGFNATIYPEVRKMQDEEMEYALTGKKSAKEALASLKKRADEFLKK